MRGLPYQLKLGVVLWSNQHHGKVSFTKYITLNYNGLVVNAYNHKGVLFANTR
jgi:hypothetical protein